MYLASIFIFSRAVSSSDGITFIFCTFTLCLNKISSISGITLLEFSRLIVNSTLDDVSLTKKKLCECDYM